jgi:hypothetical protein
MAGEVSFFLSLKKVPNSQADSSQARKKYDTRTIIKQKLGTQLPPSISGKMKTRM